MSSSPLKLEQLIFEARYDQGYLYLDRCGRIINEFTKHGENWRPGSEISPQLARLVSSYHRTSFNFSNTKLDVSAAKFKSDGEDEIDSFSMTCLKCSATIEKHLEIEAFTRIGIRGIFRLDFKSEAAMNSQLNSFGICASIVDTSRSLPSQVISTEAVFRAKRDGIFMRLKVHGDGTQTINSWGEKTEFQFAIFFDLDFYINEDCDPADDFDTARFITTSHAEMLKMIRQIRGGK